jgi:hypothetical protein
MYRPAGSASPLTFGRRASFARAIALPEAQAISPDLKLFAATYAAGFLMVSLFIA